MVDLQVLAAQRLGLTLEILDPECGQLFALSCGAHRQIYVGGRSVLNDATSTRLAEDKFYTQLLLRQAGFSCPATQRCLNPQIPSHHRYPHLVGTDPGLRFAETQGYPLIAKPNRLSMGQQVCLVGDPSELVAALEQIWAVDRVALVQERIEGRDLRLDFLEDQYLIGYERIPLQIQGDGKHPVSLLMQAADPRFQDPLFWERVRQQSQLLWELEHYGVSLETVIPQGQALTVGAQIRNLNLFCTGRLIPTVTEEMRQTCVQIGRTLGLRHFGIDLRVIGEISPQTTWVIEVNASPLLAQIYGLGYQEQALAAQCRVLQAAFSQTGLDHNRGVI